MKATITELAYAAGVSERTVRRYLKDGKWPHIRLPGGLIEIDDSLLAQPEEGEESTILATLRRIESKIDALADMFRQAPATVRHRPASVTTEQQARPSPGPAQGDLPPNLTPWRDYAREKGYSETTVKRHIDAGEIPVIDGRWKRGQAIIKQVIDETGKAAIDRLFGK